MVKCCKLHVKLEAGEDLGFIEAYAGFRSGSIRYLSGWFTELRSSAMGILLESCAIGSSGWKTLNILPQAATGLKETHTAHRPQTPPVVLHPLPSLTAGHRTSRPRKYLSKGSQVTQVSICDLVTSGHWSSHRFGLTWMHAAPSGKGGCSGTSRPMWNGGSPAQVCLGLRHTQRGTHCKKASRHRMFGSMP